MLKIEKELLAPQVLALIPSFGIDPFKISFKQKRRNFLRLS